MRGHTEPAACKSLNYGCFQQFSFSKMLSTVPSFSYVPEISSETSKVERMATPRPRRPIFLFMWHALSRSRPLNALSSSFSQPILTVSRITCYRKISHRLWWTIRSSIYSKMELRSSISVAEVEKNCETRGPLRQCLGEPVSQGHRDVEATLPSPLL